MTVWFDVEDLFHYFRSGNKRVSGIQRLTYEIYRAARQLEGANGGVGFVRHGARPLSFLLVDWDDLPIDSEQESVPDPDGAKPAADGERPAPPRAPLHSPLRRLARG